MDYSSFLKYPKGWRKTSKQLLRVKERGERRKRYTENARDSTRLLCFSFPFSKWRRRLLFIAVVHFFFFFFELVSFLFLFLFTCLSPGTSVTGLPSALIQRISGRGLPVAAHSTTVPVVLEKSMRLVGSFKKTGPDREDELAAAVAEPSPTHAPINQKKNNFLLLWSS